MKTRSLYGFSSNLPPFEGQSPDAQAALLREWGCTAVFGGYEDEAFVHAAHEAGLEIYAEFGCFVGKPWWDEASESRPLTAEGQRLDAEDWYYGVNPSVPQVRQALLDRLAGMLCQYDIDGVWLDFIRWPCHWESPTPNLPRTSFDPPTLARFSDATGIDLPSDSAAIRFLLDDYLSEWTAWRCDQITSWVGQARDVLKKAYPQVLLGLFGVPWRLTDHGGAITSIIGQEYAALGQYVDVFSPMVYHRMCGQPPPWIGFVTQEVQALSGKPVWPIIQSVDDPSILSPDEYGQALDCALNEAASKGVIVFTLKGMLSAEKLAVTRERFSRNR